MDEDLIKWYTLFKNEKFVWKRIKEQCPEYGNFSNLQLKRLISQQPLSDLNTTLKCGKVLTPFDLFTKGIASFCDCCNCFEELYIKFNWVNYIIKAQNTIKYIGHTNDLKQRLKCHEKNGLYTKDDTILISVILSEQTLYNWFKPELNKNQQLNELARVKNLNGVFNSIDFENLENENNKISESNLSNLEKYIEELNELETWCFDSRKGICTCPIKCSIRKYHNIFNNRPKYYPIPKEFVEFSKEKPKIEYIPVDALDMYTVIKARKPDLKPSTFKTIESISKKIDYSLLPFPFLYFKKLQKYNESTCKKMIGYILSFISVLNTNEKELVFGKQFQNVCIIYYKAKFILDKLNNSKKETGALTHTEEKNWVSFETLEKVLESLKEKDLQKYTILYLYLYQNTLRSDFYNLKYKNIDYQQDNFIDFENGYLVFNHPLKVDKFQVYIIQPNCLKLLKTFVENLKNFNFNSDFVFIKKNKEPFTPKSFAQYTLLFIKEELRLLGFINKSVGIQMLRKIVVSHQRNHLTSPLQSVLIAKNMNHSEYMSKFYYFKK